MQDAEDLALRLAAIVESSDDAIVSKDLTGIVRSWNSAAERMFGFKADEIIGKSIRAIIPADRQHEEDRVLSAIAAGNRVEHFETVRVTRSGTFIPISLTVSPIRDASGKVIGASKIARDISDRKKAEAHAERIARRDAFLAQVTLTLTRTLDYDQAMTELATLAVPTIADYCAIDVVDEHGELVRLAVAHVQPEKAQLATELRARYGDSESRWSAKSVLRTGTSGFVPEVTDEMIEAIAQGNSGRANQIRSLGLVSYMCVPMATHGRTLGTLTLANAESDRHFARDDLALAEDIASRAALAVENSQSYSQLQQANRLKDEFLATLSHELRTPLNAVLGYARMLRSGAIRADRTPQALDVIERNARSLTQIVEDVLDVSRIISGKARLDTQPTDVAQVVKDAMATVMPAADAKGIRIGSHIDCHVGPVWGDAGRLQQVVWNLLSNAVKFTPRDGSVHVHLSAVDLQAEIAITDSGIGFSADFLPHLFERFRQAESGPARQYGGLGLGLAIARHIVEMHGGTIEASSDGPAKGATFRVRLPLINADGVGNAAAAPAKPQGASGDTRKQELAGVLVMAVDDDPDALQLVREILESSGAHVITVVSGEAALQQLETERPQVLLSDLSMPNMDGFELIRKIRHLSDEALRRIPAAALTAFASTGDRAKSRRSGFEVHLAKPINPDDLIAAVSELAGRVVS